MKSKSCLRIEAELHPTPYTHLTGAGDNTMSKSTKNFLIAASGHCTQSEFHVEFNVHMQSDCRPQSSLNLRYTPENILIRVGLQLRLS